MASNCHLTIIFIGLCLCNMSMQASQHFSLQPAINYLSEPLRKSYTESERALVNPFLDSVQGYDGYYDDYIDDIYDERKRSAYKKRASAFRERNRLPSYQRQEQEKEYLAEKFLKAIEEEREREEQEEYQQEVRDQWNRYQDEVREIERELTNNDVEDDEDNQMTMEDMKRKRQRGEIEVAPSYWSQKRSFPLLPWLPAQRKKRFPVAKRSPKEVDPMKDQTKIPSTLTETKEVQKRSSDVKVDAKLKSVVAGEKSKDEGGEMMRVHVPKKRDTEAALKDEKMIKKRDVSEEEEDEHHEGEEEHHHHDDDSSEEEDEDEDRKKKKKRDTTKTSEAPLKLPTNDKTINVSKKSSSFEWSNIFGLDRKKKSIQPTIMDPRELKLEQMENKLKKMEDYVLDDTVKYYNAQEENLSPKEEILVKNRLAQRMATAYSLEKLRKAVERLRESYALGNNFIDDIYGDEKKRKAKRVAVKKEKAEFDNINHDIDNPQMKIFSDSETNSHDNVLEEKKKKKKRNGLTNYITENEPMSEELMGGNNGYDTGSMNCPILDNIERKCRGIDIMSGDFHQNLLDTCGAHQLCYLCGESQTQCDYDFLAEAEEMCDSDMKCKIVARQVLSALKNLGGVRISPRECVRNPCINMAMQLIVPY